MTDELMLFAIFFVSLFVTPVLFIVALTVGGPD